MKKILVVLSLLVFCLYSYKLYKATMNYAQSDRFADENDHMIGGYFLLKGKTLYKDISVVHQPLNYYFTAAGQAPFKVNSLYLFINRQRLTILAYSLFWNIVYFVSFGPAALLFTLLFEITKFWYLGNLILGETLAVYPLLFLVGIAAKKLLLGRELKNYETAAFSVATFVSVFLLLQLWPTIALLNLALIYVHRKNKKNILLQTVPFAVLTLVLFSVVPLKYYIQEVFVYNFRYYLPFMDKVSTVAGYARMVFLPLTGIHVNPNPMEILVLLFVPVYFLLLFVFYKKKKLIPFAFMVICLVSANNRDDSLKFTNFHLLPWIGTYFFLPMVVLPVLPALRKKVGILVPLVIAAVVSLSLVYANIIARNPFNTVKNVATENDINFHDINKYGLAVKALRRPGDRLIAIPSDNLIHWVSETDLATRQIEYYGWQYSIPEDKNRLISVFRNRPAEFIVNGHPFNDLPPFVKDYVDGKYVQVRENGQPSRLYILKSILPRITDKQWEDFKYLLFEKPSGV